MIQDNSGEYRDLESSADQEKKPQEKQCFPELSIVDPIGIEPTTSTLPELPCDSAKSCIASFIAPKMPERSN